VGDMLSGLSLLVKVLRPVLMESVWVANIA
jgi:hypothetical protein